MHNGVCPIDDLGTCCNKHNKMKVIACIPVFGRLPLLKHTIERLYKKNGVYKVICTGELHEKKFCEALGAEFHVMPNKPLGRKWNKAFKEAEKHSPDACLFVGSSDWLSDNWLDEMTPHIRNFDMIGTLGCHFLDIREQMRLVYWCGYEGLRAWESIGIGRLLGVSILKKLNWQPFEDHIDNGLDGSMSRRIERVGGVSSHSVVSDKVKSVSISTSMWANKHRFEQHWSNELKSDKVHGASTWVAENFPEALELNELCIKQALNQQQTINAVSYK